MSNWSRALTALTREIATIQARQSTMIAYARKGHMDVHNEAHLTRVLQQFTADARAKYEAGQQEHGGNLWQKPGLLDHAIEEAIDLVVYLYTLKEQRDNEGIR